MTTAPTSWDLASAALLRRRAMDALASAADYDRRAARSSGGVQRFWRGLARHCRLVALRNRHEAAQLTGPSLEIDAATVARARQARRCPVPDCQGRPTRGATLCPSCARHARYCWRCKRVRPLARYWGGNQQCQDCARANDPRRVSPEQRRESYARRWQQTGPAIYEARIQRGQEVAARVAAVVAEIGPPYKGQKGGYWASVAQRVGGLSPEGARAAYARWKKANGSEP